MFSVTHPRLRDSDVEQNIAEIVDFLNKEVLLLDGTTRMRGLLTYGAADSRVLRPIEVYSEATSNLTTSGTTELTLATLDIPARPFSYLLDVAAFFSGLGSVDVDGFSARIRVDTVQKAIVSHNIIGSGTRRTICSMPSCTPVTIDKNAACAITVTMQRTAGTGVYAADTPGVVTAKVYPQ